MFLCPQDVCPAIESYQGEVCLSTMEKLEYKKTSMSTENQWLSVLPGFKSQEITGYVAMKMMDGLILHPKVPPWAPEMDGPSSGRDPSTQVPWRMSHSLLHV